MECARDLIIAGIMLIIIENRGLCCHAFTLWLFDKMYLKHNIFTDRYTISKNGNSSPSSA